MRIFENRDCVEGMREFPDKYFDWYIVYDSEVLDSSEVEEPTRREAEEAAFEKAFEILEEML